MKTMTFGEYLKIDAVNWSKLKEMRRSAMHYAHAVEHAREDTTRLAAGRAVHTLILEPDRFAREYAVFEGERRAGKVWDAFKEANDGRTILKADEYETCIAMRDAVKANAHAAGHLAAGRPEVSITWTDEATGIACKGRIDFLSANGTIVDLKTTADLDMRRFGSVAARFGYHTQIAWYLRGLRANGVHVEAARIIAVEAEAPHDVGVFVVDDDLLFAGDEECRELLEYVRRCRATGVWNGRYTNEVPLEMPKWWFADEEADLGLVTREAA